VLAARHHGKPLDHGSLVLSLIGISTPIFFLALLLKYLFAVKLGWLPSVGRITITLDVEHPTNFYIVDAIITRDWSTLRDVRTAVFNLRAGGPGTAAPWRGGLPRPPPATRKRRGSR